MTRTRLEIPEGHKLRVFRYFAELVWKHLGLPPLTPLQVDICNWLQYGPKRLQVQAFRGAGKSYITSAYCLWLLLLNPDEKILVLSASKKRADNFVLFTRRLIADMPLLAELTPDPYRGDRDSAVAFDVGVCTPAHSPSLYSIGLTGQLAGSRASTIILDDVEVLSNSATADQREKLGEAVKEVDAILLPENLDLGVEPKVRLLGTPQTFASIYTTMRERGYEPRVWPVVVPEAEELAGYGEYLGDIIKGMIAGGAKAGALVEPERYTSIDIAERKLSFGSAGFQLQFMLSTVLTDAQRYPLKIKDLMFASFPVDRGREVYVHSNASHYRIKDLENPGLPGDGFYRAAEEIGEWRPYERTCVAVDPSGKGSNETAIISGSLLGGNIFVHRVMGRLDGFGTPTLEAIALEAKRIKAHRVLIEANYGGGMFAQLLRPVLNRIYPCEIEEITQSRAKEQRIVSTLQPVFESHRIIVHDSIPASDKVVDAEFDAAITVNRQLFRQIGFLTIDKGSLPLDDRVDALALLVAGFADALHVDDRVARRERQEEERNVQRALSFDAPMHDSWLSYSDPFVNQE